MKCLLMPPTVAGLLLALTNAATASTVNLQVLDRAGLPVPAVTINYSYTSTAPGIPSGSGSAQTNSEGRAALSHPCGISSGSCCTLVSVVNYSLSLSGWQFSPASGTVSCGPLSSDLMVRGDNLVAIPAVVSAASYRPALATGMIAALFGAALANPTATAEVTPLPATLGGRSLLLRDSAGVSLSAPLFFVSPQQINFLLPQGLTEGQVLVTIRSDTAAQSSHFIILSRVAPSLFSANADGQGLASGVIVRVTNDGAQNYENISRYDSAQQRYVALPLEFRPDTSFIVLALFGTGWRFRSALTATTVTIGGVNAPVQYAGEQSTFSGLDQINVELPRSLSGRGEVDVVVLVDGRTANTVRVNLK